MDLIRNTLLSVLFVQLLVFSYIKLFYKKDVSHLEQLSKIDTPQTKVKKSITKKIHVASNKSTVSKVIQITKKKNSTPSMHKVIKNPIEELPDTNDKVEKYAREFLGNKYVWGATGPKTFDCSGFTQKVYKKCAGIDIPRVSIEQAKVGKYIEFSNLKQGDMVFFDTTKKRLGKVNHVGIYLSKGNFIHASSGGKKVMITNFNKKRFYKNRFLWGRRVTQEHTSITTLIKNKNKEES